MQKLSAWTRASVLSFQSFGYLQFIIIAEKKMNSCTGIRKLMQKTKLQEKKILRQS